MITLHGVYKMSEKLNLFIKDINDKMKIENRTELKSVEIKLINLVYNKQHSIMSDQRWTEN